MRMKLCRWTMAAAAVGMVLSGAAKAQSSEPACSMGVGSAGGYGPWGRVAYTATAKTTFEQRLPDGNIVGGFMRTHVARDGAGKWISEMGQRCVRDENGEPRAQLYVSVFDPATKTTMNWNVGTDNMPKVVKVFHASTTPRKPLTPEELAAQRKAAERQQPPRNEYKTEDLGSKIIAGVEVHGSRTTRTIPPGEEGNQLQLVTTNEIWQSTKLGLVMMTVSDDPRHGKTTYEIEELDQNEPNPAVFAPPEGYKIEDHPADVITASTAQ
jgi:hypothetical protein